jgi:hypothetical protein
MHILGLETARCPLVCKSAGSSRSQDRFSSVTLVNLGVLSAAGQGWALHMQSYFIADLIPPRSKDTVRLGGKALVPPELLKR